MAYVGILLLGLPCPCTLLQAQYRVEHLPKPYNTPGSETGALRIGDTVLVYSSMQSSGKGTGSKQFSFGDRQMNVYQARIARNGKLAKPRLNRWNINSKRYHTGNMAIDPVSHDLYFTRSPLGDADLRCEIWWAKKLKRGWDAPKRLAGEVNIKGYTSTQPSVGRLADGAVILYFASNRPGGAGGMDIWYALVTDGTADTPVNLGPQVNTSADEITPFYDQPNGVLYFSSDREGGLGGYDIYCAVGQRNSWQAAEPVCSCLNSAQNDIYFAITDRDSASGMPVGGYLSSNRADSYYINDSMCCNDIYRWTVDTAAMVAMLPPPDTVTPEPPLTYTERYLPLALYFHNDDPDPASYDSMTTAVYSECQSLYAQMRDTYMAHQPTADDSAAMQEFFDSCVVGNYGRLQLLLQRVQSALDEEYRVELTVSGFASPVFTSEYNRLLSSRRIGSFVNMLRVWNDGCLEQAMADGRLSIVQCPMGIDNNHLASADPVYSLHAALARRIEVVGFRTF